MTDKISDLAGIDPSYAERLHDDHVRDRHCDELERLQREGYQAERYLVLLREERDQARAEVERLIRERDRWTEDAINMAGESARQDAEIERLQGEASLLAESFYKERADNERLRAALEHVIEVFAGFERMGAGGPAIEQAREALREGNQKP